MSKYDPDFLPYDPLPPYEFNKPKFDPIIPPYTPPPSYEFNRSIIEPVIPPPTPIYNFDHDLVGWKPELENHIYTPYIGTRYDIDPGGFVRDPMDNLIGQMGPGNVMFNPCLPSMPDYGPPQSTPEAWDPGYSPMEPFG